MATERKALVVHYAPGHDTDSLDALTTHLNDGWRLISTAAMGGAGGATAPVQFACLAVVEREKETSVTGFSSR